jgi:hypothetical protein
MSKTAYIIRPFSPFIAPAIREKEPDALIVALESHRSYLGFDRGFTMHSSIIKEYQKYEISFFISKDIYKRNLSANGLHAIIDCNGKEPVDALIEYLKNEMNFNTVKIL